MDDHVHLHSGAELRCETCGLDFWESMGGEPLADDEVDQGDKQAAE